jgi:hypothetical protein
MATTTPNYSWTVPTSSDLVKNGATAIETLGDSVDDSLWSSGYGQAGKNKIINGDFTINQRAFTTTTTSSVYTFDRFQTAFADGTNTYTAQTFTPGAAPVAGYESRNFIDVTSTGQTLTSAATTLRTTIENVRTFAGQTATVSFWAKAATGTPSVVVWFQQVFGTGGSPSTATNFGTTKKAITTSWARYSFTVSVPSITGKTLGTDANSDYVAVRLTTSAGSDRAAYTDSLGIQSATISFWGVQVEYGSKATPFQLAGGGDPQSELAMCQRYYWRAGGNSVFQQFGNGLANSTTIVQAFIANPVYMRIAPSSIDFTNLGVTDSVSTTAVSAVSIGNAGTNGSACNFTVASGLTQFRPYIVNANNSTSAYIGFSAEL